MNLTISTFRPSISLNNKNITPTQNKTITSTSVEPHLLKSNYNFPFNTRFLDNRFKISFGQDNSSLYERAMKENWSRQDFAWYNNEPSIIDEIKFSATNRVSFNYFNDEKKIYTSIYGSEFFKNHSISDTFDDIKFDGADFSNMNFQNSSFANSKFINVDFSNSNLSKTNFSNAIFENCNFENADLNDANLKGAVFLASDVSAVKNMNGCDKNTQFYDKTFSEIKKYLLEAISTALEENNSEYFNKRKKEYEKLIASKIGYENLKFDYNLSNKLFKNIDFSNMNFDNLDMENSQFFNTDFSNCHFRCCSLKNSEFEACKFDGAIIKQTDLQFTKFKNTNLATIKEVSKSPAKNAIIDGEINKNNSLLSYYSRKENPDIGWVKLEEL